MAGLDPAPLLAAARLEALPHDPSDLSSPHDPSDLSRAVDVYLSLVRENIGAGESNRGCVLASFLPGVVTGVTKLLTSDANVVESEVALGLVTWGHYVVLVMCGGEWEELVSLPKGAEGEAGQVKMVDRTEVWLKDTANRLCVLIQRMCVFMTSEVWRVRVQLVGWAHSLLYHCSE